MGNIVFNQAAEFLRKRRNARRWMAAVLCLALVVTSGTFTMLTGQGSALSDAPWPQLDCVFKAHVHEEACYGEEGEIVCGYADSYVHQHNENCCDSEGNLVCMLEEMEAHEHDESCYVVGTDLVCVMEEHKHTESCFELVEEESLESGATVRDREDAENAESAGDVRGGENGEHARNEEGAEPAQNEEAADGGEAVQGEEPVKGTGPSSGEGLIDCTESRRLVCEQEEHAHGAACYNRILICGKAELHTHSDACYTDGNLTCGKLELVEHVHGVECFKAATEPIVIKMAGVTFTASAAEEGIIPEGAILSVTPVVRTEPEILENLGEEEKVKAEELNTLYDGIRQGLCEAGEGSRTETVGGFLAYDIDFLTVNEDGEEEKADITGEVTVKMEFDEAALPKEIRELTEEERALFIGISIADMEQAEDGSRKAEPLENAEIETTQAAEIRTVEIPLYGSATIAIAWMFPGGSEAAVAGNDMESLGEPAHEKYIQYNPETKDYTLTLDVTGKKIEKESNVDFLLVLDTSGSMGLNSYGGTDINYFNFIPEVKETIINTIAPQVLADDGNGVIKNRFALVTYSDMAERADRKNDTVTINWTNKTADIEKGVNSIAIDYRSNTNWQLGMVRAEKLLSQVQGDGNQKVVLFISDGEPNLTLRKDASGNITEPAKSEETKKNAYPCALQEVMESDYLKQAKIYSIYLTGGGTAETMTRFAEDLKANGIDAVAIDGTSSIQAVFGDIVSKTLSYKDVEIADTLSEYVDLVNADHSAFTVKSTGADGTGELLREGEDYDIAISDNEKTITLTLKGELEADTTYSVSFHVKPSEIAEKEYAENKKYGKYADQSYYPHIGGEDTDAEGNDTSSKKPGFYSNDEAVLRYRESDQTEEKSGEYNKPVIQTEAEQEEAWMEGTIEYDKTAKVIDWDERTYQIDLSATSKIRIQKPMDILLVLDASNSMNWSEDGNRVVSPESSGIHKVEDLDKNKIYYYGNGTVNPSVTSYGAFLKCPMVYMDGDGDGIEEWWYYDYQGSGDQRDWTYDSALWKKVPYDEATGDVTGREVYVQASRITLLKEKMISFVRTAMSISGSKVGVVSFGSTGRKLVELGKITDADELIKKVIATWWPTGSATHLSPGLTAAKAELDKEEVPDTPRNIVVFCDGELHTGPADGSVAQGTAMDIKKNTDITIYTVGYGPDAENMEAKYHIASDGCHTAATKAQALEDVFGAIFESIGSSITDAEITDTIDPRFEIVEIDENGKPVRDNQGNLKPVEDGTILAGGVVGTDAKGNQYVEWVNQTVRQSIDGGNGWQKIIVVKAKDTYIGGNDVPTNVPEDSRIRVKIDDREIDRQLPEPHVNVKERLLVNNKEVTIYKGDTVPTEDGVLMALFDTAQYADVKNGKYVSLTGDDFALSWFQDADCRDGTTVDSMKAVAPDSVGITYYLQVIYRAGLGIPTDSSNANTTINGISYVAGTAGGEGEPYSLKAVNSDRDGENQGKPYGVYRVRVVSGEIQITKMVDMGWRGKSDKEQTFCFTVTRKGTDGAADTEIATVAITVPADADNTSWATLREEDLEKLKNLERGTYVIQEKPTADYVVQSVVIGDGTNCHADPVPGSGEIVFVLGNDTGNADVIDEDYQYAASSGGTIARAVFTNERVDSEWAIVKRDKYASSSSAKTLSGAEFDLVPTSDSLSHTTYRGISGEDGRVVWYETDEDGRLKTVATAQLAQGEYILKEIAAPDGYMISELTWTIGISSDGALKDIDASGELICVGTDDSVTIYYDNVYLYELPGAGASGIYRYLMGGILLMTASVTFFYRCRTKQTGRCRKA